MDLPVSAVPSVWAMSMRAVCAVLISVAVVIAFMAVVAQ